MSLFRRRSIAKFLQDCSAVLDDKQYQKIIKTLNREDRLSLHAQWELGVVYAFTKLGKVDHEPLLNQKRPDIVWTNPENGEVIVADVRTVSDAGLERENPRDFYRIELRRQAQSRGFNPSCFTDYPRGELVGRTRDTLKMRLMYPPIKESTLLFGADFEDFLQFIRNEDPTKHEVKITGSGIDVTIYYSKNPRPGDGGGNPSFKVFYSLKGNPIYNALLFGFF
jgi:hypothetical protein